MLNHVKEAIERASRCSSNLSDESKSAQMILDMEGYSGNKSRHLFNNLCNFDGCKYMEIGIFKGSTFFSSLYKNSGIFYGIDNWSKYGDQSGHFNKCISELGVESQVSFFNVDSFKFDVDNFDDKINVYFYDGDHTEESQKNGIVYFEPVFDDQFILIVDDYSAGIREQVKKGTQAAIKEIDYSIKFEKELFIQGTRQQKRDNWWCGLYVALMERNK